MPVPVTATMQQFILQSYMVEVWYRQDPDGVWVMQTTGKSTNNDGACEFWDVCFLPGMEAPNFLCRDVPQNRDIYRVSSLGEYFPPCIDRLQYPNIRAFVHHYTMDVLARFNRRTPWYSMVGL